MGQGKKNIFLYSVTELGILYSFHQSHLMRKNKMSNTKAFRFPNERVQTVNNKQTFPLCVADSCIIILLCLRDNFKLLKKRKAKSFEPQKFINKISNLAKSTRPPR